MVITVQHVYEPPVGGLGFGAPPLHSPQKQKVAKKPSSFEDAKRLEKQRLPDACLAQLNGLKKAYRHRRSHQQHPTQQHVLENAVGHIGISLLSCAVDMEFFRDSQHQSNHDNLDAPLNSLVDELDDMEIDVPDIYIKPESPSELTSCPRILTPYMMHYLLQEALPLPLKTARWDRIYAVGRDGDTFYAMLEKCIDFKDTVIVAQTSLGHIVGGYASSPWTPQGKSYFGTGMSFLFGSHAEIQTTVQEESKEEQDEAPLDIFKWTGRNTYSQVCDAADSGGILAMGGEGGFGLLFQDNFSRGSTGHCKTFGNPSLVPGGHFDVVNFEVYGFTTFGATTVSEDGGFS